MKKPTQFERIDLAFESEKTPSLENEALQEGYAWEAHKVVQIIETEMLVES